LSQPQEHTLLQLARDGERDAFTQLQATLEGPARRFVRKLVGTSDAEDDIIQNAFFALYMNLERLDDGEKLRPFLFRVLRNQCYDELRAQGRYEWVSVDADDDDVLEHLPAETHTQPEEKVHWLLLYSQVQYAIEQLPEQQRQTLLLYTTAELSYTEIAEVMNTSVGTVKSRLHYAKRNLVRLLPEDTLAALNMGDESEASDDDES
jgi:RNA polymerase sigma-70 factor (ECF subfamily)